MSFQKLINGVLAKTDGADGASGPQIAITWGVLGFLIARVL